MVSISTDRSRVIYEGNGAARSFSFDFKVWDTAQIRVVEADEFGTETDVTGKTAVELSATGGTVTLPEPPAQGHRLAVYRSMPFLQEDRYLTGTRFDAHEIEDALDVACAERQELREKLGRTVALPITSTGTGADLLNDIFSTRTEVEQAAEARIAELKQTGADQVAEVERVGKEQTEAAEAQADRACQCAAAAEESEAAARKSEEAAAASAAQLSGLWPIGSIYVQYGGQETPEELFGGEWQDISDTYAGRFFRVVGEGTAAFGENQEGGAPNISGSSCAMYWAQLGAQTGPFSAEFRGDTPAVGSTAYGYSVIFNASKANAAYNLTEFRPINHTVRIWKRTA